MDLIGDAQKGGGPGVSFCGAGRSAPESPQRDAGRPGAGEVKWRSCRDASRSPHPFGHAAVVHGERIRCELKSSRAWVVPADEIPAGLPPARGRRRAPRFRASCSRPAAGSVRRQRRGGGDRRRRSGACGRPGWAKHPRAGSFAARIVQERAVPRVPRPVQHEARAQSAFRQYGLPSGPGSVATCEQAVPQSWRPSTPLTWPRRGSATQHWWLVSTTGKSPTQTSSVR